jgi:predicted short-subunit dehydrogenase-like oxidoreductase (DUF2520 family)
MKSILVGPGRAGVALSLRLVDSGHSVVGVLGRDEAASRIAVTSLGSSLLDWETDLPPAELLLVAVRDDAIAPVAQRLASLVGSVDAAVHLSGLKPVSELAALDGPMLGSFHPLQTLPTAEVGARRLEGAWAAITSADDFLADRLFALATSMGMHPFELEDEVKPLYHAAAASAANYPLAALAMAKKLFEAAGVPYEAAAPLVAAVIENAAELGPVAALTGPVARGDVGTVTAQLAAVAEAAPELLDAFTAFARLAATTAGTDGVLSEVLQ